MAIWNSNPTFERPAMTPDMFAPFRQAWFDAYADRQNPTMLRIGMALTVPFIAVVFGFAAYFGLLGYAGHKLLSSGVRTVGEVRSIEVRQHRSRGDRVSHVIRIGYAFTDLSGVTHEGQVERHATHPYMLAQGDRLEILYDGANPGMSQPHVGLEHESRYHQGMSLILFVCGLYGCLYFPRYKSWQQRRACPGVQP